VFAGRIEAGPVLADLVVVGDCPVDQGRDVGTAEIDAVYRARTERGRRVSRHLVTNLHVVRADEAGASVISALLLYADDGEPSRPTVTPLMVADVVDEFVRTGDRWLISSRHVREMFRAPDSVLAVPTRAEQARPS
jgi:hypothetical protein